MDIDSLSLNDNTPYLALYWFDLLFVKDVNSIVLLLSICISQITSQIEQFLSLLVLIFLNMDKFCKQQGIWYGLEIYVLLFDEKKNIEQHYPLSIILCYNVVGFCYYSI